MHPIRYGDYSRSTGHCLARAACGDDWERPQAPKDARILAEVATGGGRSRRLASRSRASRHTPSEALEHDLAAGQSWSSSEVSRQLRRRWPASDGLGFEKTAADPAVVFTHDPAVVVRIIAVLFRNLRLLVNQVVDVS